MDRRTGFVLVLLLVLTAASYAPLRGGLFVYEDANWLGSIETRSITWAVPGRALTMWTHQQVGADPGRAHLVNVGIHLVNGSLVAALAVPLVGGLGAVVAAGVFLRHPLNSEAVSYISARADLLMTCGILLACVCALQAWRGRWVGVGLGCLVAAHSQELGIVALPLVLLLLVAWRPQERRAIGLCGLALLLAGIVTAARVMAWLLPLDGGVLGWHATLWAQSTMLGRLLALVVWPWGFSIDHDAAAVPYLGQLLAALLTCVLVPVAALNWGAFRLSAWMLGVIALTVGPRFVFRTDETLTEHDLYAAMVAVSVGVGAAVVWLAQRPARERMSSWDFLREFRQQWRARPLHGGVCE